MAYKLEDDLWFCLAGEHPVFLDLRKDRYFRLPASQEHAFISFMRGGPTPDYRALLEQALAIDGSLMSSSVQVHTVQEPRRSALEQALFITDIRPATVCEVYFAVASALLQLKTRALKNVLASMRLFRERRTIVPSPIDKRATEVLAASCAFNEARLYVPVAPCCLLDSLALVMFLARRRIHSTIVFGVTCTPFSAHSWVQAGDTVLNDTVGNANSYTPIGIF